MTTEIAGPKPKATHKWLKRVLVWSVTAAIFGYLAYMVPTEALADAFARTSLGTYAVVMAGLVVLTLLTDSLALWSVFISALPETPISLRESIRLRGACYLLSVINYSVGQGGVVYFLKRNYGVNITEGIATVLLSVASNVLVVSLLVAVGLLVGSLPDSSVLQLFVLACACGTPVYLVIIAINPTFLSKRKLLKPLFRIGVRGTLWIMGFRLLHVTAMLVSHWIVMHMFGIEVAFTDVVARLPLVFLMNAVPLTPGGLGTAQATAIFLFSEFVPGSTETAQATVLAYSLSIHALSSIYQALIGATLLRGVLSEKSPSAD